MSDVTAYAAVSIPRRVPQGRSGTYRHPGRSNAQVEAAIRYGRGEHDGLVGLLVRLAPDDQRYVEVLAEDVWVDTSPLAAAGAAAQWAAEKYPAP